MSILGPNHVFTFAKKDNVILSATVAASHSATHQPPSGGSYLRVTVSGGTSNTGTVSLSGSLVGVPKTETLTYTGARWKISVNQYDAIDASGVTTSGLADEATKPTILIEACDAAGTPKTWTTSYVYYGQFVLSPSDANNIMMNLAANGLKAPTMAKCKIDTDADVDLGDEFSVQGQVGTWLVWSQPMRKFDLGSDLVKDISFFATLIEK